MRKPQRRECIIGGLVLSLPTAVSAVPYLLYIWRLAGGRAEPYAWLRTRAPLLLGIGLVMWLLPLCILLTERSSEWVRGCAGEGLWVCLAFGVMTPVLEWLTRTVELRLVGIWLESVGMGFFRTLFYGEGVRYLIPFLLSSVGLLLCVIVDFAPMVLLYAVGAASVKAFHGEEHRLYGITSLAKRWVKYSKREYFK